jgi:hypothetical protein
MRREGREGGRVEKGAGRVEGEGGLDLEDAAKNDETWYPNEP